MRNGSRPSLLRTCAIIARARRCAIATIQNADIRDKTHVRREVKNECRIRTCQGAWCRCRGKAGRTALPALRADHAWLRDYVDGEGAIEQSLAGTGPGSGPAYRGAGAAHRSACG